MLAAAAHPKEDAFNVADLYLFNGDAGPRRSLPLCLFFNGGADQEQALPFL